jgi:trans-aconitate methyltransferase
MTPRLYRAVSQLPVTGLPPRLLDVGCGDCLAAEVLLQALPGWVITGVDLDGAALDRARKRLPSLLLVEADAATLPGLLHTRFGLILVRHPDLFARRASWNRILPMLPELLAPGGWLVITLYAPDEVDLVRALSLPPGSLLNEQALAPADLAGRDRFILVFSSS